VDGMAEAADGGETPIAVADGDALFSLGSC